MIQVEKVFSVVLFVVLLCSQSVLSYAFEGEELELQFADRFLFQSFKSFIWLPDGENILYESNGILYQVNIGSGDTDEVFDITDSIGSEYVSPPTKIALTPDGSSVVFGTQYKEGNGIVTVDLDNLEVNQLTEPGGYAYPTLSPDGKYMLYFDFSNSTAYLYNTITDTHTVFHFPETPDPGFPPFSAVFGPDSEYIYFCQLYDGETSGYTISRIPVTGGNAEILTDRFTGYALNFNFAHGGNLILFNDKADVLILDQSTGTVRNALTGDIHTETRIISEDAYINGDAFKYARPAFSPNDSLFAYYVDAFNPDNDKAFIVKLDPELYPKPVESDSELILAVSDNQPESYATLANFPNPFNPSTTIEFTLPEAGNAKLVIYDITGRKVRELADGHFSAGTHSIQWNACDDAGRPVSSGVYVSRLESGDAVATNRMTLVR